MISSKDVKRTFKVVLNSYNTNSYIGSQFNASYYVDLTKIIPNDADFDKQYKVYCTFRTKSESIANNEITSTNVYTLSVGFNNSGLNTYDYDMYKNQSFILKVENITDTGGTIHTLLDLVDSNAQPIFIQNIRNLTQINLTTYLNSVASQSVFNPATPNNSKYICVLTFEEC